MTQKFASRLGGIQISMIRQIMDRAAGCVNLGIGEPDFFAPANVRREACRIVQEEKIPYSPNAGLLDLRSAVHAWHGSPPGHSVCVCNGSQEALFDLLFALVDPGDEVLVPNPGFVAYPVIVRLAGGIPVSYRLDPTADFTLDRDHLAACFSDRTRIMILNTPSNPTGRCLTYSDLEFLCGLAEAHGTVLISDEIYREIYYTDQRPPTILDASRRAVVVSGVSKMACMTGWRVGWACGPTEIIEKMTVMHQYTSSCASTLGQRAALEVFTEEGQAGIEEVRLKLADNARLLCGFLRDELGRRFVQPEGAFYLMLDVRDTGRDSLSVALDLLKDGVATIPGAAFGSEGEGFLRLSFACEQPTLLEGLGRLKRSRVFR